MKIIDIPGGQRGEAWHQHRKDHDNASDAPAMAGVSPYETRTALLTRLKTGITPEVSPQLQALYDEGHRCEALARPLAELIFDEDLYPLVKANGRMSASLDGHNLAGTRDWEHKLLNDTLRAVLPKEGVGGPEIGRQLPEMYLVQVAHQQHCSGAQETLFTASKWEGDKLIEARHCWVERDEARIAKVVAGWQQLHRDLADFTPPQASVAVVATPMEHLPAVSVQTSGSLVVHSNLDMFGERLRAFVAKMPKEPETDQEFVDLDAACKRLKAAEDAIDAAVNGALASVEDVEKMRVTALQLVDIARTARLASEKVVKNRKDEIKAREVKARFDAVGAYMAAANTRLGGMHISGRLDGGVPDFGAVIKNLRTLESVRDKLDTALSQAKMAIDAAEQRIAANLKTIAAVDPSFQGLFADRAQLVQKDPEAVAAIVAHRIAEDMRRIEAEVERVRLQRAAEEDALCASIETNAVRIEGETVGHIRKAITAFETGARSWADDPRPRVAAAIQAGRLKLAELLAAAEAREAALPAEVTPPQSPAQVLKAEPAPADATAAERPAHASPRVGAMGVGQPADAGPAGDHQAAGTVQNFAQAQRVAPPDPEDELHAAARALLAVIAVPRTSKFPSQPKAGKEWFESLYAAAARLEQVL